MTPILPLDCPNCNIISYVTWDFIQPPDRFPDEPTLIHFICQNCDYEWYEDKESYL